VDPIALTIALNVVYEVTTLFVIVLGLAIVFGLLRVMNLAHGEFIMIGAYSAYFCQDQGWPYITAIPFALIIAAVVGYLIEFTLIRHLYKRPFDTLLVTWGLSILLRELIELVYGKGFQSLSNPIPGSVNILGEPYPSYRALVMVIAVVSAIVLWAWYRRSLTGARVKAMVENTELAQAVGIRVDRLARHTFVVGTCFGALAGVMLAPLTRVEPFMGLDYILTSFFVLVVGGIGTLLGLTAGAGVIGGVQSVVANLFGETSGYFGVLLIAILFLWLKPNGLVSRS
jgi:branched-chain amino acid transport system permease protein/urea transport system permease protein|tara:strand:- start:11 stop:865 length:855 start_codon:yes stop_codon:yes gene_type:complete